MSTSETALAPQKSETPTQVDEVFLVARDTMEMQESTGRLDTFLRGKLHYEQAELRRIEKILNASKKNKWRTQPLKALVLRQKKRIMYYEKCVAALDAGYTLIPSFPMDVFAIRVTRALPSAPTERAVYGPTVRDENPQALQVSEGRYVSPSQQVRNFSEVEKRDGKDVKVYFQEAVDFNEVAYPLQAASPVVMEATARAMALKLFDEIGICPRRNERRGDPLIIGRIKTGNSWADRQMNFLIAWCVDKRRL